jgi:hypothetical protein
MALETTTTTSMENGYGFPSWGYGGYGHQGYGSQFCDVQQAIGDAKASILTRVGDNEARLGALVSHAEGTITTEVNDAECAIIDKMGGVAADLNKNLSDIALRQAVALNEVERDLQNRIHESRQIATKELSDATRYLEMKTERVSDKSDAQFANAIRQLSSFEISVAKQFGALEVEGLKNTSKILETLSANKYDALKDEVDAIRADRYADKYGYNFALQNQELNSLKQMINSVEQSQRFGSKTVQFGTGNLAGTAQTANQG